MSKQARLMVQGKPFFSLGGQTHNSSSYTVDKMARSWNSVKALGGNTVATPVPWDAFEPVEGQFNEKFVDVYKRQHLRRGVGAACGPERGAGGGTASLPAHRGDL